MSRPTIVYVNIADAYDSCEDDADIHAYNKHTLAHTLT